MQYMKNKTYGKGKNNIKIKSKFNNRCINTLPFCYLTYGCISNKGLFIGHHSINRHLLEVMNCNYSNGGM